MTSFGASERTVVVTGAAGFVGMATIRVLLERGHRVRAFVRDVSDRLDPRAEVCLGDVRDGSAVSSALEGADTVVHLAARKADQPDSFDVNVGGARTLVEAATLRGIRRIVNVSTEAALFPVRDRYGESKAQADRIFAASGLPVVTLLPSLVYGDDPNGVFGKIVGFIRKLPVVPVVGPGTAVFQPLHVDDLARVIVACVEADSELRPVYHVAGPEAVSFDQIIDAIQQALGTSKPKLHLPWWPSLLAARALRLLLRDPPVTVSNVLGAAPHNTALLDPSTTFADLRFEPTPFRTGLLGVVLRLEGAPAGSADPSPPDPSQEAAE